MCDYSLELYNSRKAETNENLILHRFPSGTMGFVGTGEDTNAPGGPVACCVLPGATLILSDILVAHQKAYEIGPVEEAVFVQLDVNGHAHRDAVRFANGKEISLQCFTGGLRAQVTGNMAELEVKPAKAEPEVVAEFEYIL